MQLLAGQRNGLFDIKQRHLVAAARRFLQHRLQRVALAVEAFNPRLDGAQLPMHRLELFAQLLVCRTQLRQFIAILRLQGFQLRLKIAESAAGVIALPAGNGNRQQGNRQPGIERTPAGCRRRKFGFGHGGDQRAARSSMLPIIST